MSGEEHLLPRLILEKRVPGDTVLGAILRYYRCSFLRWRYLYENPGEDFYTLLDRALTEIIDAYDKTRGDSA